MESAARLRPTGRREANLAVVAASPRFFPNAVRIVHPAASRREETVLSKPVEYASLWAVLTGAPSLEDLATRIAHLPEDELRAAAIAFVDARTELVAALSDQKTGASEDILDDLAGFLVRQGGEHYSAYLAGTRPLPPREEWGSLEKQSPIGVFSDAIEERLNQDIYDLWEEAAYD